MDYFIIILISLIMLSAIKSVIVGSDFSFANWFKYGKLYTRWYNSRPTFKNYLKNTRDIEKIVIGRKLKGLENGNRN